MCRFVINYRYPNDPLQFPNVKRSIAYAATRALSQSVFVTTHKGASNFGSSGGSSSRRGPRQPRTGKPLPAVPDLDVACPFTNGKTKSSRALGVFGPDAPFSPATEADAVLVRRAANGTRGGSFARPAPSIYWVERGADKTPDDIGPSLAGARQDYL